MRRYLIIGFAIILSLIIFLITFYLLKKISKNPTIFYPLLSGLITFISVLLFCFLYLENNAGNISQKYDPPKIINGEIVSGQFKKD